MSLFNDSFGAANDLWESIAGENFVLIRNGTPGTYAAISIDDVEASTAVAPGGLRGDNSTVLFVRYTVIAASGLIESSVLEVRGKRVRVTRISDGGDGTRMLTCTSAGVDIKV